MIDPYTFELVRSRARYLAYLRLRRAIFCEEQGLFERTDEDEWDPVAYPIVAMAPPGTGRDRGGAFADEGSSGAPDVSGAREVVGVVRIYEAEPGVWYGGRLGVDPRHRKQGVVGRGLIEKAVTLAHGWGCRRFLALVQVANVPLFEELSWRSLETRAHRGRPHRLMEAELAHYPPSGEPRPPPAQGAAP